MRPWLLSEARYGLIKDGPPYEAAVLPLGATEPHNLHLPYGTDTLQVESLGERACAKAWERGARVLMLPAVPYGTETNLSRFPYAMNVGPRVLGALIADLVESLANSGTNKLLLLNGHGGNDLKWLLRDLYGKTPVHLFLCHWYQLAADVAKDHFEKPDDHAGEMETSLVLSLRPELVDLPSADEGSVAPCRFEAVRNGWVGITRPWHLLTTNSGSGDPRAASAQKGANFAEVVVERLAGFLVELAASPIDERFPL